ncbi:FeoB-associated Cys-rich membrane protein [Dielma fastidiosa]|nr:FeoB-associated Cys-rich membrane protein [Dielma fastidiosa]
MWCSLDIFLYCLSAGEYGEYAMKLIDIIVLLLIAAAVVAAVRAYRKKPSCCHDGSCNHACAACNKKCKEKK